MRKKHLLISAFLLCTGVSYSQQSPLLEKYRSMALEYSHDLKSADKNYLPASTGKKRRSDWKPKLSGNANFQYTGQPLQLTLDLPSLEQPMTFEGRDLKYGASLSLLQPVYTGGRILESIRMAGYRHSFASNQEELFRSAVCYQTIAILNTVARREIVGVAPDTAIRWYPAQTIANGWGRPGRPAELLMVESEERGGISAVAGKK